MKRAATLAFLCALLLVPASASASEWPDVPPDTEGPPWGGRRFQALGIRAGLEYAMPLWGDSGSGAAAYAPPVAEGWKAGIGWAIDLEYSFCPEYALFLTAERFSFPSAGAETIGTDTHEFGPIGGTAVAAGLGIRLPLSIETELWLCTVAPPVLGPVLYASLGAGAAMLDELTLEVTPVPAEGNLPWWDRSAVLFGCARVGFEVRLFRFASLFLEAAGGAFLPKAGSARPGADGATALAYAGLRGGVALFLF